MQHFQRLTFNLTSNLKRYETLEGRRCLVVPAVVLTEGVHDGSQGPLLYENAELEKFSIPAANYRPAVIYHPTANGEGISATDPTVLEKQKVGVTMNTQWDGRSKMEVWFDEDKLKRVDPRVHTALENNQPVEVSTGLYHDLEKKSGTHNGQAYVGIVRNMKLDHLAILPDQTGACSIAKGAGLLRNAADHGLSHNDIKAHLHAEHNGSENDFDSKLPYSQTAHIVDVFPKHVVYEKGGEHFKHGYKVKQGKAQFDGEPEKVRKQTSYITANNEWLLNTTDTAAQNTPVLDKTLNKPTLEQMSPEMRKQQFQRTLEDMFNQDVQKARWGGWVQDLLAGHVVWSKDGKLFRLPYVYDNDKIKFDSGDPEEVEKVDTNGVSEYRRKEPVFTGSATPFSINSIPEFTIMATKAPMTPQEIQKVGSKMYNILMNACKLNSDDAKKIVQNAIHQGAHELIREAVGENNPNAPDGKGDGQARDQGSGGGGDRKGEVDSLISGGAFKEEDRNSLMGMGSSGFESVKAAFKKGATTVIQPYSYDGIKDRSNVHNAQTLNAYLASVPLEFRELIEQGLTTLGQRKGQLVQMVQNARGNKFTPEQLAVMPVTQLEALASLVQAQAPPQTQNGMSLDAQLLMQYGGGNGTPVNPNATTANYAGAASAPMFDVTFAPTNNNQAQGADLTLPLPSHSWADEQK